MDDLEDLGFINMGQGQNEISPYNPWAESGGEAVCWGEGEKGYLTKHTMWGYPLSLADGAL